jgi:hypothetical protein
MMEQFNVAGNELSSRLPCELGAWKKIRKSMGTAALRRHCLPMPYHHSPSATIVLLGSMNVANNALSGNIPEAYASWSNLGTSDSSRDGFESTTLMLLYSSLPFGFLRKFQVGRQLI